MDAAVPPPLAGEGARSPVGADGTSRASDRTPGAPGGADEGRVAAAAGTGRRRSAMNAETTVTPGPVDADAGRHQHGHRPDHAWREPSSGHCPARRALCARGGTEEGRGRPTADRHGRGAGRRARRTLEGPPRGHRTPRPGHLPQACHRRGGASSMAGAMPMPKHRRAPPQPRQRPARAARGAGARHRPAGAARALRRQAGVWCGGGEPQGHAVAVPQGDRRRRPRASARNAATTWPGGRPSRWIERGHGSFLRSGIAAGTGARALLKPAATRAVPVVGDAEGVADAADGSPARRPASTNVRCPAANGDRRLLGGLPAPGVRLL